MSTLYQRVVEKGITVSHVCEVGVFEPETSNVLGFINHDIRATLVEADPDIARRVEQYFSGHPITVHAVAIWDYSGRQKLARASASSFIVDVKSSPTLANDNYRIDEANTFDVDCLVFSAIDDGTIDLISIDIEGGEWYVLKYMVSRPHVISIETHGKNYVNPFMAEIADWMQQNGYQIWYKDHTDSVYSRQGVTTPTLMERTALLFNEFNIVFRRRKGRVLKSLGVR